MNSSHLRSKLFHTALCSAAFGVSFVAFPSPGLASPVYLSHLTTEYGAAGDCTLCHTDNMGGDGTISRKFGQTLESKGLLGDSNIASLDQAIAQLGDADSDGDGASDLLELTEQGNPNDPTVLPGGFVAPEEVEYGCVGGTIAGTRESSSFSGAVAAGLVAGALLLSRRWRG